MKPFICTLLWIWLAYASLFAQVPQQFAFQGVARNGQGQPVSNQTVGVRLTIHQGSASGNTVYGEIHSTQTASSGVFTIPVGGGSVYMGTFTNINWSAGPYFLQVELDPTGGSNYAPVSTSQLLSTPYALVANNLSGVNTPQNGDLLEYQNGTWGNKPKTQRYNAWGVGSAPTQNLSFLSPTVTVTITKDNPIITADMSKVLGSVYAYGAVGLTINLGYQKIGGAVSEFNEEHRFTGLRVVGGVRAIFGRSGTYQTSFKVGDTYLIGLVGFSTQQSSNQGWNDNGLGGGYVEVSY